MVKIMAILAVTLTVVMLLSGTCWAAEKPIGDITSTQQVIDKLFAGRALDPIEGIWVKDERSVIAIVKTSFVNTQNTKYKNTDYIGIIIRGNDPGEIYVLLKRTEFIFSFKAEKPNYYGGHYWKLLTPTLLQFDGISTYYVGEVFVRTYPTP